MFHEAGHQRRIISMNLVADMPGDHKETFR
jgi:hypothetical protein